MFDGLKDKLGNFRDDVEEAAEEKAEAEAEAEADAEGEAEEAPDPETGDTPNPDAGMETEEAPVAEAESAPGTGAEAAPDASDPDRGTPESDPRITGESPGGDESDGSTGDLDDADAGDLDDAAAGGEEEADDESAGFVRKARSLAKGKFVIEEEDLEEPLWDLKLALVESDVEIDVAEEILDGIREELVGETRTVTTSTGAVVEDALRSALLEVIEVGQFDFDGRVAETDKPVVIVFTGVNGVGKTTSIAKLARYFEERGLSTVLANGDTYRAGANEQIEEHADNLGKKLISHEQGGDPTAVIYDAVEYAEANDVDVVLGDTAGRLHTDDDLMDQLEKIHRVVEPDMTLFVDEAVAGQDAVRRAREFDEAAEVDGTILTKADADAQGGAAISIAHVTGKPILFLGTGQDYDDLVRFDPEWLVDQLLGGE